MFWPGDWHYWVKPEEAKEVILWLKTNYGPSYTSNINHGKATYRNKDKTCVWTADVKYKYGNFNSSGQPVAQKYIVIYMYRNLVHFRLAWGFPEECPR